MLKAKKRLKTKQILIILTVVVVVALIAIAPLFFNAGRGGTTITKTTLKDTVSISKLSTAEFTYEGIATKETRNGAPLYYIYYKASANTEIDLEQIDFEIDEDKKTITPLLPTPSISSLVIDETALDFLPKDAEIDIHDVIEICKADAAEEISKNPLIKDTATQNMRTTIEALLSPILKDSGFTIVWNSSDISDAEGESNEINS